MKVKSILTAITTFSLLASSVCGSVITADAASSNRYYSKYNPVLNRSGFYAQVERVTENGSTTYQLHDSVRHIWVGTDEAYRDAEYFTGAPAPKTDSERGYIATYYPNYLWTNYSDRFTPFIIKSSGSDFKGSEQALGVLVQVEKAYDYYANTFGWKGTDGNNSELVVNAESRFGSLASGYLNFINFMYKFKDPNNGDFSHVSDANDLDCVVHEYTHRVTANKVHWSASRSATETGALNEAYSDIMGEYADKLNWTSMAGTDRNAKISSATGIYSIGENGRVSYSYNEGNKNYFLNYKAYTDAKKQGITIEAHDGSTILSHAAYLMDTKFNIPDYIAEEMWFKSMNYLPKGANNADFRSCRSAVLRALDEVLSEYRYISADQKDTYRVFVRTAFEEVGIPYMYSLGDVNKDNKVNTKDKEAIKDFIAKKISFDIDSRSLADVNFDGKIDVTDMSSIAKLYK